VGDGGALPGGVAFKLYDTYGFPIDLTQDAVREQGKSVDVAGFEAAMAEQRQRARAAWAGSGEAATDTVWFELRERVGATEFLGYSTEAAEAAISALVVDGKPVETADVGAEVAVLLNQTPFYAESGGQVGDTGIITVLSGGGRVVVSDTQKKLGSLFVHLGRVEGDSIAVGQPVRAEIDHVRRSAIRASHSATHLLHEALRRRLGTHVAQKGSLNAPDRLRFDVSQPTPISRDDLAWVEGEVNAKIRENSEVTTRLMTPDAAVEQGAMALFGEKYGEEVRVVSMGIGEGNKPAWSIELCGGTHVRRTGDIGLLRIVAESPVAAGVRRIEAVTGAGALAAVAETERRLAEVASALKVNPAEVADRVAAVLEDRRRLERQVSDLQRKLATGGAQSDVEIVAGVKLAARNLGDVPARELKSLADAILKQIESGVVALVSTAEGKASVVVAVSPDLAGRFDAVALVRTASAAVGGKGGGGRPDMAQAGGPDAARADAALAAVRAALAG
jgi:alanyl-tRNA synthetase